MENLSENKLGTMPVGKLLTQMSLPIVCSMLVQALYNVVDCIFVARYDALVLGNAITSPGLTAVSLAFPFQNLMIAFGVGTSVGIASLLSRRLGEKNFDSANRTAANGLFLGLVNWLAFALVFGGFAGLFFQSYANSPEVGPEIAALGTEYLRIVSIFSLGLFWSVVMERLLQATGRSSLSMVTQMLGAVVNIILDPIMIFGYFGFPEMGVAGAAIATVIGQYCGMLAGLFLNIALNKEISIKLKGFRPSLKTIKHIYQVGLPSIITQSIGSVMTFGINLILAGFSAVAVSVFGIYFKLQSFIFLPVYGINNGMVPIVAYNFGARKRQRIAQAVRYACYAAFTIMVLGLLAFWVIPDKLLLIFEASAEMIAIGTTALRIISLSFPLAAISIVFSGFFQAIGEGMRSLIMSVVRQLVFLLPIAWVFSKIAGLDAVWFAFPISEIIALVLAVLLFRHAWKVRIMPLDNIGDLKAKSN